MSAHESINLLEPLAALQRVINRFDQQGMIIGGVAARLMGCSRVTNNLDAVFLVSLEELPKVLEAARDEGIIPRIEQAQEFAHDNRVLLLRHQPSGTNVNILLGMLPFEMESVAHSHVREVDGLAVRLPSAEDLIVFKAIAHRPVDLEDIACILGSHPEIDWNHLEYWLKAYAESLENPKIWDDIAPLRQITLSLT